MTEPDPKLIVRDLRAVERTLPSRDEPTTMVTVIRDFLARGGPIDQLDRLLSMKRELDAEEAKKLYFSALASWKATVPVIVKNKRTDFKGKKDPTMRVNYAYASHDEVTLKLCESLSPFGLSHQWFTKQEQGTLTVTCRLSHSSGYSEETSLTAPDDTSGLKSPAQAVCSTKTLLERYTLLGITGVSTRDVGLADDDNTILRPGADKPAAPEFYADWQENIVSFCPEGIDTLQNRWQASPREMRLYTDQHNRQWWESVKDCARRKVPFTDKPAYSGEGEVK